jgi:hypothetical protein
VACLGVEATDCGMQTTGQWTHMTDWCTDDRSVGTYDRLVSIDDRSVGTDDRSVGIHDRLVSTGYRSGS